MPGSAKSGHLGMLLPGGRKGGGHFCHLGGWPISTREEREKVLMGLAGASICEFKSINMCFGAGFDFRGVIRF